METTVIAYRTLREHVADIIRKKILNHELEPGMRVLEQNLAQEFGISRGPVREALRQLEQEGLVEYTQNRGCSVRGVSLLDVLEAFTVRGSYELTALKAIRGNFTDESLAEMEKILEHMKSMTVMESINYDNMFHKVLISASNMPYLSKAWDNLDFVAFFSFYNEIDSANMLASDRQYKIHKGLFDIYCKKDFKETKEAISKHYLLTIYRKLEEHDLTEKDLRYSLDILKI